MCVQGAARSGKPRRHVTHRCFPRTFRTVFIIVAAKERPLFGLSRQRVDDFLRAP